MVEQGVRFASLAPNIQVKFPATSAGIVAIEEATFRGVNINATVSLHRAAGDRGRRGGRARPRAGARPPARMSRRCDPVCTLMIGRLDDWMKVVVEREDIAIDPDATNWAGIAVFKRAYRLFRERGYRARLLAAAYRHRLHWTELVGGDVILTMPHAWQVRFNAAGIEPTPRIDVPVDPAIIAELDERFPDFRRAYEPDGLRPDEFDTYGATVRTLRGVHQELPRPDGRDPGPLSSRIRTCEPDQAVPAAIGGGPVTPAAHATEEHAMTTEILPAAPPAAPPILSHWIDGRPVEVLPEQTGPVYNPATGEVIARVPRGGAPEVDAAVAAARRAFPAWRDTPLIARSQIFFAYRELVWRHREELAALITRDHGKTFPDALAEVLRGLETVEFACGLPTQLAGMNTPNVSHEGGRAHPAPAARRGRRHHALQLPGHGPDVDLSASRSPAATPSSGSRPPTRPARPSSRPSCGQQAGLPDGVFNIVYGGREAVDAILEHPGVDAIQFVGSHAGRAARLRDRHPERQARGRVHRRQERHGRPARRGPRPRRRRRGGGRLRHRPASAAWPRPSSSRSGDTADRLTPDSIVERIAQSEGRPGHGAGRRHGPHLLRRAPRSRHRVDRPGRRRGRASSSSTGGPFDHPEHPDGFFLGVSLFDHVTPEMEHLHRGDLRPGPGHRPRSHVRRGIWRSSTATSTATAPPSSPPTAAPRGASSSRSTCP